MTSREATLSKRIVQTVHDLVRYSSGEVVLSWESIIGFTPSDQIRSYVTTLLKEVKIDSLLMGSSLIVTNRNPISPQGEAECIALRAMMVKVARRIFDIIRYRLSGNGNQWFKIDWADLLDNGRVVPKLLRDEVVKGLNQNGIEAFDQGKELHICADYHSLDNPFFQPNGSGNAMLTATSTEEVDGQ